MYFQALRFRTSKVFCALIALTASMGTMQATNLLTATTPVSLTCSTTAGLGASASIVVKPVTALTGANTIAVTFANPGGGLVVTAPVGGTTLNAANSAAGITYTVNLSPGCVGSPAGSSTPTIQFKSNGNTDVVVTANATVTATTSALVPAPSTVALTCTKSGSLYGLGSAKTVSVTSGAPGGTAFTVDTSASAPPTWATLSSTAGGTASSSAVTFTVTPTTGCGGFAAGTTTTGTIHLLNAPAPDKVITVTIQIIAVPSTPLTVNPTLGSFSYVKGSGTPGYVDIAVNSASSPKPFFAVDTTTLPIWLNVDSASGTAPKSVRFSSTAVADTLAPGTYNTTVHLTVSGYGDQLIPISMLVTNPAAHLSTAEGTARNISWTIGTPIPAPFITLVSTDSPIPYTITTAGTAAPIISASLLKGLAYSFGTAIPVTFDPLVFAAAQPGAVLTGTATVVWGSPASSIVVVFNITVQSAGATLTAISPASLPTASAGQTFSVSLIGTGFVPSTDPTQKTKVGIVVGGTIVPDTNIATTVVNASNITLTVTVPVSPDPYLPFSPGGAGGSVSLGVCNPTGGSCSTPTGTATLSIGSNPIIQAVTSASAFQQVTPPTLQTMAPYDLVSIFGTNFCTSGGTGCSSTQVLYGSPDPITLRYPAFLSPDSAGSTQRQLSVTFQTHGSSPTVIGTAALLFAMNGQINMLVPAALSTYAGQTVDFVVNFGYGTGATMKSSSPFQVSILATNPGVFTIGSDGQGDGAILGSNYSVVSSTNPAGMRTTASDSDIVQIFMSGLGVPNSSANNATAGTSGAYFSDCVSVSSFLTSLSTQSGVTVSAADGAVVQSSLLNSNRLPPCLTTAPTVTIGGVPATVTYAGWVADSIAGLYQVNARLPGRAAGTFHPANGGSTFTNLLAPVQLPVVVTAGGNASQANVSLWVAPQLKVTPPSGSGLSGTVGTSWSNSNNVVTASEGTSSYSYAVTSGLLPSGLALGSSSGAISGIPAANTAGSYVVTVTATDSANIPVTGATTFTLNIAGGLVLTAPGAPFTPGAAGSVYTAVTTVQAAGGVYPYTYAVTSSPSAAGITIDPTTGIVSVDGTVATGTYHVTVTATDSTSGTPLTGSITFDITLS